jgi:hypothetical protein
LFHIVADIDEKSGDVKTKKQFFYKDAFNSDGYKVPNHKAGAKMFYEVSFPKEMNDSEIGKMARLAKLMIADSNMLGYRTKWGIRAYTSESVIKLVGLSPRRGRQFLDKMKRLGIMQLTMRQYGTVNCIEYYINPAYFFAGGRIGANLYLLFREQLDPILTDYAKESFWKLANEMVKK